MGRKNLSKERTAGILDAFSRCIVRYGLEGASLEKIAEEAGVKRPIIRHYIGNRDQCIIALTRRIVEKYEARMEQWLDELTDDYRLSGLMEILIPGREYRSSDPADMETVLVLETLIAAADRYPEVKERLRSWTNDLVTRIAEQLALIYPKAEPNRHRDVAYGMISISFNQESLAPLDLEEDYHQSSRYCAMVLARTLE